MTGTLQDAFAFPVVHSLQVYTGTKLCLVEGVGKLVNRKTLT